MFPHQPPFLSISISYPKKMLLPGDRDTTFLIARFLIAMGRGVPCISGAGSLNDVFRNLTTKIGFGGLGGVPLDPGCISMQNAGVFASGARMVTLLVAKTIFWTLFLVVIPGRGLFYPSKRSPK